MDPELRAADVAERLAALRACYVPESDEEARRRLARERPTAPEPFDRAVARRLGELRALCELTNYLHGALRSSRLRTHDAQSGPDPNPDEH